MFCFDSVNRLRDVFMDENSVIDLCRYAILSALIIAALILVIGMIVGLVVGLMQADSSPRIKHFLLFQNY